MTEKNRDHPPTIIETKNVKIPEQKPPNDKIIEFKIVENKSKKD